ncbi:helix-turn-helix domain-containing protein [Photobacterium sp. 53610]|uniref:helix-turn-helix domain-containing protein n=1 Tax=Photobacterium sp. 53610 TaxID=3102789 RepID=UPI002ED77926
MEKNAQIGQIDARLMQAARLVPQQVGQVKLSKTQLFVLRSLRASENVTAEQVAARCGLSKSWASTLLKRINEKGYLVRESYSKDSGGIGFIYTQR